MPVLSVITAVAPGMHEHLPETYESLRTQELPAGWEWEWLVQCDSMDEDHRAQIRAVLPGDEPRLSYRASRTGGPGVARTMTLARARGELAKTLNADDRLAQGSLMRDIHGLSQPDVHWAASRVIEFWPGGGQRPHSARTPPAGRVTSGELLSSYWSPTDTGLLVHPATLCVRMRTLLALGGWMALPASEDTALMLALDAVSDGWYSEEVGLLYRCWDRQMTAQPAHFEPEERNARRRIIAIRAEALRSFKDSFRIRGAQRS
ncbi:glycosyltransferase family A protein [Streptoalloteichus hindustanus]|uniref:Glycosyl transferase family 2 n=1 Tax=Streptoalloteichus hindustanus TaxID=2017 RepID=A0A1M5IG87_STRHI|nr:glycosyltransferase family A protein [Streptoalloteichus hindustanus]SHG27256.1 hypothetical protein SAMN05444320_107269 [Streptoalloteichus hindustanus]